MTVPTGGAAAPDRPPPPRPRRPGGPSGPVRDAGDRARVDRFVDAARHLANRTGSAAFTVAQVVEAAGLSLKAFYRCFGGKDDLLVALLGADSRVGAELLTERMGTAGDPAARLRAFVDGIFTLATLPGAEGYAGVLVREHRRLRETHADALDEALRPLVDLLATEVAALGSPDPARDAQTIFELLLIGLGDVMLGRRGAPEVAAQLWRFPLSLLARGTPPR